MASVESDSEDSQKTPEAPDEVATPSATLRARIQAAALTTASAESGEDEETDEEETDDEDNEDEEHPVLYSEEVAAAAAAAAGGGGVTAVSSRRGLFPGGFDETKSEMILMSVDDVGRDSDDPVTPTPVRLAEVKEEPAAMIGLDDLDAAQLRSNLEVAIATIQEMHERLVASNQAIETVTRERNAARRELAQAQKLCVRLTSAAELSSVAPHATDRDLAAAKAQINYDTASLIGVEQKATTIAGALEESRAELKTQAERLATLDAEYQKVRQEQVKRVDAERRLAASEAKLGEARADLMRFATVEADLVGQRAEAERRGAQATALEACFAAAAHEAGRERTRAVRAEQRHAEACAGLAASLEREAAAAQRIARAFDDAGAEARRRDDIERALAADRTDALNRAVAAERTCDRLDHRLEDLGSKTARTDRAHLGARFTLERARLNSESEVHRALDARRSALLELEATKEQLRIEVRCRSAASQQLREIRLRRDVEKNDKDAALTKHAELTLKYKRTKAELDELRHAHHRANNVASEQPQGRASSSSSATVRPRYNSRSQTNNHHHSATAAALRPGSFSRGQNGASSARRSTPPSRASSSRSAGDARGTKSFNEALADAADQDCSLPRSVASADSPSYDGRLTLDDLSSPAA